MLIAGITPKLLPMEPLQFSVKVLLLPCELNSTLPGATCESQAPLTNCCDPSAGSPYQPMKHSIFSEHILFPPAAGGTQQAKGFATPTTAVRVEGSAASLPHYSCQQTNPNRILLPISKQRMCLLTVKGHLTAKEHRELQTQTHTDISKSRRGKENPTAKDSLLLVLTFFFMAVLGITHLQRKDHLLTLLCLPHTLHAHTQIPPTEVPCKRGSAPAPTPFPPQQTSDSFCTRRQKGKLQQKLPPARNRSDSPR